MTYAVVGHAGRSRWGEGDSPGGSHRPLAVASCRHRAVYEQKKLRSCGCFRRNRGEQLPGSGATLLLYPLFSRTGHSPASSWPFRAAEARHGLSLTSRRRSLDFSAICRPDSSHRSVLSFEGPETSPAGAAGSGNCVELRALHRLHRRLACPHVLRPGCSLLRSRPGRVPFRTPRTPTGGR
jgi:hypothetical protein